MENLIAGVVLTVVLLIGIDVALNIKDRIEKSIARNKLTKIACHALHSIEKIAKEAEPKVERMTKEEARKARNREKMAEYRAKKRAAKKTK